MNRFHIHISVDDLEQNIRFYSLLFGSLPSVSKDDYAKWDLAEPAMNFAISRRGAQTGLDHVGIQAENAEELATLQSRLQAAGISGIEQSGTACCYARSDKYWIRDPQGIAWEAFHTLDSIPSFNEQADAVPPAAAAYPPFPTQAAADREHTVSLRRQLLPLANGRVLGTELRR